MNERLPKGTRVEYHAHHRMARGGGWTFTKTTGTIVGYYADQYRIQSDLAGRPSKWGITTREPAQSILRTLPKG